MEEVVNFVGFFSGVSESQTVNGEVVNCNRFDGFILTEDGSLVRSVELPLHLGNFYEEGLSYHLTLAIESREFNPTEISSKPVLFSLYESLWDFFFVVKVLSVYTASMAHVNVYSKKKLILIREIKKRIKTSSNRLSYADLKSVFGGVSNNFGVVALPVAQADSIVAKSNSNVFFDIGIGSPYNKATIDGGVTTPQQLEFFDCQIDSTYILTNQIWHKSFERDCFTFITHFDTDHYSYLHGKGKTNIRDFNRKLNSLKSNKFNRLNIIERYNVLANYYVKSKILSEYFIFPLNIEAFNQECKNTISDKYLTIANLQFILEVMDACKGFYIVPHSSKNCGYIKLKLANGGRLQGHANWIDNDSNNSGISYSLNLPKKNYLFTGDKCFKYLPKIQMSANYNALMACHHGAEVIDSAIPKSASRKAIACFSFGFNKRFKHPRNSAIQQASEYKIQGTCKYLYWYQRGVKPTTVKAYKKISVYVKLS
ncbi:hypothetical protein [Aliivibrio logei]|uniref:Uncharacterized protein n=1 Tax=Aliivibrio logei TaxID=688 RepID=A0A1B9P039_ALILO|nr:hypothetical protein [Aliivibrio logei]OCH21734.1 hypothetical protein A6E04_07675 [Aliivibrio logei]